MPLGSAYIVFPQIVSYLVVHLTPEHEQVVLKQHPLSDKHYSFSDVNYSFSDDIYSLSDDIYSLSDDI